MPAVPEEMKRIADEKDFVLIRCLRNGWISGTGSHLRDHGAHRPGPHGEPGLCERAFGQVSRLPRHQRTVDTMLKMLSERMMASLPALDGSLRVLNEATWPHSLGKTLRDFLEAEISGAGGRQTSA